MRVMAGREVRIEVRGLANERVEAERDLRETLGALEEKLLPRRAVQRLVRQHNPALVLTGVVAAGLAIGFMGADRRGARVAGLLAAATAGVVAYRLATS
jgi:hypothetical protein